MTPEMVQMANAKLMEYLQKQNFNSLEEINEFLRTHINGKPIDQVVPLKKGRKTNDEKSDDLLYQALDSDPKQGLMLVREALKYNPDNVRALNYLGEQEKDVTKAIEIFKKAMEAGARQLGEDFFAENKGHFWGMHETRPYMAAKFNYANCLSAIFKTNESIKEYNEILALNPNDNQGVRYILASDLLYHKKYKAFLDLFKKFDEASAYWLFNYALYLFATEGRSAKANKALIEASKQNKHMIPYMTRQKIIKVEPDGYYSPGDEREAAMYLMENLKTWMECKGTADWLFSFIRKKPS